MEIWASNLQIIRRTFHYYNNYLRTFLSFSLILQIAFNQMILANIYRSCSGNEYLVHTTVTQTNRKTSGHFYRMLILIKNKKKLSYI